MPGFCALFAALLLLPAPVPAAAAAEPIAATLISLEGEVVFEDDGALKPAALGQLFADGDRLITREGANAQLVLADGSSLALGPNSEVSLKALGKAEAGSKTVIELIKGLINAFVEKLADGSSFEVHTANAVAAVKGTDFEMEAAGDAASVAVNEGEVELGDSQRKAVERIRPLERARLAGGRLQRAQRLSKREAGELRGRWDRARLFHQGRKETLRGLRQEGAAKAIRELERRRVLREERRERERRGRSAREERREGKKERRERARESLRRKLEERRR